MTLASEKSKIMVENRHEKLFCDRVPNFPPMNLNIEKVSEMIKAIKAIPVFANICKPLAYIPIDKKSKNSWKSRWGRLDFWWYTRPFWTSKLRSKGRDRCTKWQRRQRWWSRGRPRPKQSPFPPPTAIQSAFWATFSPFFSGTWDWLEIEVWPQNEFHSDVQSSPRRRTGCRGRKAQAFRGCDDLGGRNSTTVYPRIILRLLSSVKRDSSGGRQSRSWFTSSLFLRLLCCGLSSAFILRWPIR